MTQLRWLILENKVTAKEISDYRKTSGCTTYEARQVLTKRTAPVLQCTDFFGRWQNIPVVVEEHDE